MRLTDYERRMTEMELVRQINHSPTGIDTRKLTTDVKNKLVRTVPNINRYHIVGMLSWVIRKYGYTFLIREPGHSVIMA